MKSPEISVAVASQNEIDRRISELKSLLAQGFPEHALILGFAVLEAAARRALKPRLATAQRPGSVVETLAFEGFISPNEADQLRSLIKHRNRIVHGDLGIRMVRDDVEHFIRTIEGVWTLAKEPAPEAA